MLSLRPVVSPDREPKRELSPGGTAGGLGAFFIGLAMVVAGGYLGLSLLPLLAGIAFLFFDGKSIVGWLLTAAGAVIILAGVLMHMDIYFRQTSLFNTLVMLALLFGGVGLVARSLRAS
jgi:uncharacterized protein